jgi:phosphoribosylaminoimidazole-succinocarboxamide synthase
MIASDRISAFDVVLPKGIPYKGQVLNQIAAKFLNATKDIVNSKYNTNPDIEEFFKFITKTFIESNKFAIPLTRSKPNSRTLPRHMVALKRERNILLKAKNKDKENVSLKEEYDLLNSITKSALKNHKNSGWEKFISNN